MPPLGPLIEPPRPEDLELFDFHHLLDPERPCLACINDGKFLENGVTLNLFLKIKKSLNKNKKTNKKYHIKKNNNNYKI